MLTDLDVRPFLLSTPDDVPPLHVVRLEGQEAVSRLFRFRLEVTAPLCIAFEQVLGRSYTLELRAADGAMRRLSCVLVAIRELGLDNHDRYRYRLELRPQAWRLTQAVDSTTFDNTSAKCIIESVLRRERLVSWSEHFTAVDFHERPFCVQYFESDYDFLLRLMEEEGYCYFFTNDGLRFTDSLPSAIPAPAKRTLPFHLAGHIGEAVSHWRPQRRVATYRCMLRDPHLQTSERVLSGDARLDRLPATTPSLKPLVAQPRSHVVHYPGGYAHLFEEYKLSGEPRQDGLKGYKDFGGDRAWLRLLQEAGGASVIQAVSNCRGLYPGLTFSLAGSDGDYVILSVRHRGTQPGDHSSPHDDGFSYKNTFTCIPLEAAQFYRPKRTRRKPEIHGCQIATVVHSVDGICTDKYGRVLVTFPWEETQHGRCWVPCANAWTGQLWGSVRIPRAGERVIVSFLDGDPDRPVIVGSVYDAHNKPPYDLPSEKRQSGFVSRSTPAGNSRKFNELRFDDNAGKERLITRAQRDRHEVVVNDTHVIIGHDRKTLVGGDESTTIGGNRHEQVGGTLTVQATDEIHLKAAKIVIEADRISLRTKEDGDGSEFIHLASNSGITIDSKGSHVWLNCGGAKSPDSGTAADPAEPVNPYQKPK